MPDWTIPTPGDIEARAEALGTTMAEVCRRAGVARSNVTRAKRGETSLSVPSLKRLIEALDQIAAARPDGAVTPTGEAA